MCHAYYTVTNEIGSDLMAVTTSTIFVSSHQRREAQADGINQLL